MSEKRRNSSGERGAGAQPRRRKPAAKGGAADKTEAAQAEAAAQAEPAAQAAPEAQPEPTAAPESDVAAAAETGAGQAPLTDAERAARLKQQLKALRVRDVVADMIVNLVALAYQKLGLTSETRELRNLDDAGLAIESLRGMIQAVEGVVSKEEGSAFRATLDALQIQYAQVVSEQTRAAGGQRAGASEGGT